MKASKIKKKKPMTTIIIITIMKTSKIKKKKPITTILIKIIILKIMITMKITILMIRDVRIKSFQNQSEAKKMMTMLQQKNMNIFVKILYLLKIIKLLSKLIKNLPKKLVSILPYPLNLGKIIQQWNQKNQKQN